MNVSGPLRFANGWYVNEPLLASETVPRAGALTSEAVSGSPSTSMSLARTPGAGTVSVVSSAVAYESFDATGASLTLFTVIETVAMLLLRLPSLAR